MKANNPGRAERGFATASAILMIAIVAAAVTAAAGLLSRQNRYAHDERLDVQLRQMLLAGARISQSQINETGGILKGLDRPVPLPGDLAARGGVMHIRSEQKDAGKGLQVRVEATLDSRSVFQVLDFETGPNGWRIVNARIERPRSDAHLPAG